MLTFLAGVCVGVATHYLASMQIKAAYPITFTGENYREASGDIAAVRSDGQGIIATLTVRIGPGDGRILIDTYPLIGFDFQYSGRIAVKVAAELTNTLLDNDSVGLQGAYVLFMVSSMVGEVEIQAVDGPSAGAAATIATVAAIENKRVKGDVIITGTIGEDHKIGHVGEVAAKAKAANDIGASLFLVPEGQYDSYLQNYATQQGWQVQIQEVATIEEAAALMLE
jgi:predicted S18 family serine protease